MSSMSKTILVGRLGGDPEIRYASNGNAVANFSVATSERWTDKQSGEKKEKTEWHRIVIWGKLAEICGEYLKKGALVYLEGKNETEKYTDKDGIERYTTKVVCHEMKMLGSKDEGQRSGGGNPSGNGGRDGNNGSRQQQQRSGGQQQGGRQQQQSSNFDDDDIPF